MIRDGIELNIAQLYERKKNSSSQLDMYLQATNEVLFKIMPGIQ
jgi:hypothetical protein